MHNSRSPCSTTHMLLPNAPGTAARVRDRSMRRLRPGWDSVSFAVQWRVESTFRLPKIVRVSAEANPKPYCIGYPVDRVRELLPSTVRGTASRVCIAPHELL